MSGVWEVSDVVESEEEVMVDTPQKRQEIGGSGNIHEAEWLSGSWPLPPFDGTLPPNNRKAEWIRFRDQYIRIVSCKAPVGAATKLTGMKIFAGSFLLNIIEVQEKLISPNSADVYLDTIEAVNRYFNRSCDPAKERMKFREMKMRENEPYEDWVLRLEGQAKYCDFDDNQREEEFRQALLRRSIPEISVKLYEASVMLGNDLQRIINQGKHLDEIRRETGEVVKQDEKPNSNLNREEDDYKAVNVVRMEKPERNGRYDAGGPSRRFSGGQKRYRDWPVNRGAWAKEPAARCTRCGRMHGQGQNKCAAFRVQCWNCGVWGHFAEFCQNPKVEEGGSRDHRYRTESVKGEAQRINQVDNDKP